MAHSQLGPRLAEAEVVAAPASASAVHGEAGDVKVAFGTGTICARAC